MQKRRDFHKFIFIFLLGCLIAANFYLGFSVFTERGGQNTDDFMMRYRESKYLLNGINPFDVVLHIREPEPFIGKLWDVAGYTPWGMAMGILFNLTFLPESTARFVFAVILGGVYIAASGSMYYLCRKQTSCLNSIIMAMLVLIMPGWVTGLQWLNAGAILGIIIFWAILLLEKHPYAAGILFGIAAIKPQLAAPFFLCLLFVVKKIDISANAKLIEGIQNSDLNQNMHGNFQLVNSDNLIESYKCMYQIQSGALELRHIFSDYSSIMQ